MIHDVRSYFKTVLGRLSGAFRIEDFTVEKQAEFWNIAVEYLSEFDAPSYEAIVKWADTIFKAPIHLVYRKQDEKYLTLLHRQLLPENFNRFKKIGEELSDETFKVVEEIDKLDIISLFEQQISNIDTVIDMDEDVKHFGRIKLSIGDCERIPLYGQNGLWGIYCVGPYVMHPKALDAKISIVGRTLSRLLIQVEKLERKEIDKFEIEANERIGSFGLGTLNIKKISRFFLRYICNYYSSIGGLALELVNGKYIPVADYNLDESVIAGITGAFINDPKNLAAIINGKEDELKNLLESNGILDFTITPFTYQNKSGFLFLAFDKIFQKQEEDFRNLIGNLSNTFGNLLDFRERNFSISESVIDTYYDLLRGMEKSKKETYYHTPRVMALAEQFSTLLGLDDDEKEKLIMAAKLHDIGYTGAIEINEQLNVGGELEHPIIGELMVKMLPIDQDIKSGIRMHHEWVNGSGTPKGLHGSEITWTGKIIAILEYITEFIENNQDVDENEWDNLEKHLIKSLIDRTDKQFDIVLVPMAINLIRALKWKEVSQLGVS